MPISFARRASEPPKNFSNWVAVTVSENRFTTSFQKATFILVLQDQRVHCRDKRVGIYRTSFRPEEVHQNSTPTRKSHDNGEANQTNRQVRQCLTTS